MTTGLFRHKSSWSVCTRTRRRKQSSCRARYTRHENHTRSVTAHLAELVAHGHHEHQHTRERPHDNSTDIGDTHGKRHANPCPMRCTGHLPKLRAARAHAEQQQPSDGRSRHDGHRGAELVSHRAEEVVERAARLHVGLGQPAARRGRAERDVEEVFAVCEDVLHLLPSLLDQASCRAQRGKRWV